MKKQWLYTVVKCYKGRTQRVIVEGLFSSKGNIWIHPEPLYHFTELLNKFNSRLVNPSRGDVFHRNDTFISFLKRVNKLSAPNGVRIEPDQLIPWY